MRIKLNLNLMLVLRCREMVVRTKIGYHIFSYLVFREYLISMAGRIICKMNTNYRKRRELQ